MTAPVARVTTASRLRFFMPGSTARGRERARPRFFACRLWRVTTPRGGGPPGATPQPPEPWTRRRRESTPVPPRGSPPAPRGLVCAHARLRPGGAPLPRLLRERAARAPQVQQRRPPRPRRALRAGGLAVPAGRLRIALGALRRRGAGGTGGGGPARAGVLPVPQRRTHAAQGGQKPLPPAVVAGRVRRPRRGRPAGRGSRAADSGADRGGIGGRWAGALLLVPVPVLRLLRVPVRAAASAPQGRLRGGAGFGADRRFHGAPAAGEAG